MRHVVLFSLGLLLGILIGALVWASQPRPAAGRAPTVPVTEGYDWEPWPSPAPTSLLLTPEATPWLPGLTPPPATRKQPAQVAVPVTAQPSRGRSIRGTATWYCGNGSRCTRGHPGGLYAAAGSELRTGNWRGRRVTVTASNGRQVVVTLIDTCQCRGARVIDLYADAFRQLAPLSAGVLRVTVR